jgi:hypothetical protein
LNYPSPQKNFQGICKVGGFQRNIEIRHQNCQIVFEKYSNMVEIFNKLLLLQWVTQVTEILTPLLFQWIYTLRASKILVVWNFYLIHLLWTWSWPNWRKHSKNDPSITSCQNAVKFHLKQLPDVSHMSIYWMKFQWKVTEIDSIY